MDLLKRVFASNDFMPHGYCYMWNQRLVWLHVVSDVLIALAYLSIPITLVYFLRKRRDLPFNWMFACFGVFILACGTTHAMEVWTLWHATYWLSGVVKAVTAAASVPTAILLVRLIPQALALPSPAALRREIEERKRAENALQEAATQLEARVLARTEELRRSEERFRLLVENVKDYAIFALDPQGNVSSWNAGAHRTKGYEEDEIAGRHFSVFYPPAALASGKPELELKVATQEGSFEDEGWRVRKDGSQFWAHVVITAMRDQQEKLIGFSKITHDLTERKKAEEAIQATRTQLAHMARVKTVGELTASIAHEINQPLTAVVANANACRRMLDSDTPDMEEVRQAVVDIAESGTRASEVIARIRALLKKKAPEKAMLNINEIIQAVVALAKTEADRNSIVIHTALPWGLPPVMGDKVELQQVILNLLVNGIEAMVPVIDRARVLQISSQLGESGEVTVAVQDSGTGFTPEQMGSIFDTFFTTKQGGMGMGLPISRSIIEAHGGKLWATPNLTGGATFQFTLATAA
jgi:PAS domain S-box-containing protein